MVEPSDFNDMNLEEHKKYLHECGVSVSGYLKIAGIVSAVERMVLPVDPNFEKDQTNEADELIIHDMVNIHFPCIKTVATSATTSENCHGLHAGKMDCDLPYYIFPAYMNIQTIWIN